MPENHTRYSCVSKIIYSRQPETYKCNSSNKTISHDNYVFRNDSTKMPLSRRDPASLTCIDVFSICYSWPLFNPYPAGTKSD